MLCVYCNKRISDSAKFCGHCSSPVPRCPVCGRVAAKGIRFCEYDGTEIPAAGAKSFEDDDAIDLDNVWIGGGEIDQRTVPLEAISETDLDEEAFVGNDREIYEGIPESLVPDPAPASERRGSAIEPERDLRPTRVAKNDPAPVMPDEQKLSGQRQSGRNRVREERVGRDEPTEDQKSPFFTPEPRWEVKKPEKPLCAACGEHRTNGERLCHDCQKKQKMRKLILSFSVLLVLLMMIPFLITSCLSGIDDGTTPSGDGGDTPVIVDPKETEGPADAEAPAGISVYQVIPGDVTWEEAEQACRERGGNLAVVSSREEFEKISMLAEQSGLNYLWLGARLDSDSDTWASKGWITGEEWTFEDWYPEEPSGRDNDGTQEKYLCMWNAKDNGVDIGWTFNDQRNDILTGQTDAAGRIGYVCEYQIEDTP